MIDRLSSRHRWGGLFLVFVLVAIAVALVRLPQDGDAAFGLVDQVPSESAEATGPRIGNLAPNFRLQTITGDSLRLSDLRGRPVFLNFWATWCGECRNEMPAMQRLADEHGDAIAVVGLNAGEKTETVRAFADRLGIGYPLLLDPGSSVVEAYAVPAIPTSLFIDADGVVRSVVFGELTREEMEEYLRPLLPATG